VSLIACACISVFPGFFTKKAQALSNHVDDLTEMGQKGVRTAYCEGITSQHP